MSVTDCAHSRAEFLLLSIKPPVVFDKAVQCIYYFHRVRGIAVYMDIL